MNDENDLYIAWREYTAWGVPMTKDGQARFDSNFEYFKAGWYAKEQSKVQEGQSPTL